MADLFLNALALFIGGGALQMFFMRLTETDTPPHWHKPLALIALFATCGMLFTVAMRLPAPIRNEQLVQSAIIVTGMVAAYRVRCRTKLLHA